MRERLLGIRQGTSLQILQIQKLLYKVIRDFMPIYANLEKLKSFLEKYMYLNWREEIKNLNSSAVQKTKNLLSVRKLQALMAFVNSTKH